MSNLRDFNPAIKYGAKLEGTSLDSGHLLVGDTSNEAAEVEISGDAYMDSTGSLTIKRTGTFAQGLPFIATSVATGTAILNTGAGTVVLLAGSTLAGRTAYVTGCAIQNVEAVAISGGSEFVIEDTAGTKIWIASIGIAVGATAVSGGSPGVNLQRVSMNTGTTAGIVLGLSGGSIVSDGTVQATIWGLMK
jgi:hypothetical protein